jgi:ankyrin repeat protein
MKMDSCGTSVADGSGGDSFNTKYQGKPLEPYCYFSIEAKDSLNAQDVYGYTPLHLSTMENHEDLVKALLACECAYLFDVHMTAKNMTAMGEIKWNTNELTALHFAARMKLSLPIVKALLEHLGGGHACSMILDKSSSAKTPLHYATEYGN